MRKDEASLVKYGARAGEKAVMLITLKKDGASPQGLPGAQSSPDPADVLYVVDGQEMASKDFENISPERIASITVYRGEEAVSRYGDKARNGVLVVATKGAVPKDGEMAVQGIVLDAKGEPVIGAVIDLVQDFACKDQGMGTGTSVLGKIRTRRRPAAVLGLYQSIPGRRNSTRPLRVYYIEDFRISGGQTLNRKCMMSPSWTT